MTVSPARLALSEIECWVFDLDNTLYPGSCSLYPEVEARMTAFIMAELKLERDAAQTLRKRFLEAHGTTLRGLMNEYAMPPGRFLEYCHELDLSGLPQDERLAAALTALPGRKLVFTNATVAHAERVLKRLGIAEHFFAIHDVIACDYVPKPDPSGYRLLLERHRVAAPRAAMVEDVARNLVPAAALGMTTVWIRGGPHSAADPALAPHIHHTIDNLAEFLERARPLTPAAG